MDKINKNIIKKTYIKILITLFFVSTLIAICGNVIRKSLGYDYVFHSWLNFTYLASWVLMIGLVIIISFTYINIWLGVVLIPFVLCFALLWGGIGYNKEIRQGGYIVTETQQLGEKVIRYYEDINIFIMKRYYEETIQ